MRRSPAFPCPFCQGMDWSYDENLTRWVCSTCVISGRPVPVCPDFKESFDFSGWYRSTMDDWESINRALSEHESSDSGQSDRDKLIWKARKIRIEEEYERATTIANIASSIMLLIDSSPSGDVYVNMPELELEVRHRW